MDSEVIEQIRATADQDDVNVAIGIIAATQDISIGDAERWLRRAATALRLPAADLARFFLSR
ncbi:ANTAR domain-containing protein [Streptomyces sp. SGAir0957]